MGSSRFSGAPDARGPRDHAPTLGARSVSLGVDRGTRRGPERDGRATSGRLTPSPEMRSTDPGAAPDPVPGATRQPKAPVIGPRAAERARGAAASAAAVLGVVAAGIVAWRSAPLLALLVVALLIAVPLRRAVEVLQARGLRRELGVAAVLVVAFAAFGAVAFVVLRPAAAQAVQLVANVPALLDALRRSERAEPVLRWLGGRDLLAQLQQGAPTLAREALGGVASAATGIAGVLGADAIVLVAAVLFVATRESPLHAAAALAPASLRPRWGEVASRIEARLAAYLAGLAAVVAVRAAVLVPALALLGIPFFLALGLVSAVTALVPYFGAVVRFVLVAGVALATNGPSSAAATLALLAAYDVVENAVVSPLVFRVAIDLSPIVQFLAVLFLGYHLGVPGAIVALPVAAAIATVREELRKLPDDAH
jgi:predicted PurR-regulated permease PerM